MFCKIAAIVLFLFVSTNCNSVGKRTNLCKENENATMWDRIYYTHLFHNETKKCYPPYSKGPCDIFSILTEQEHNSDLSEYGICTCKNWGRCRNQQLNRPIAKSDKDGKCYPSFTQANCDEGEWFTVSVDNNTFTGDTYWTGSCNKNPCVDLPEPEIDLTFVEKYNYLSQSQNISSELMELNKPFWFTQKDGKCYKTFSQGPCPNGQFVILDEYTYMKIGEKVTISCVDSDEQFGSCSAAGSTATGDLNCPVGMKPYGDDCIADIAPSFS